MSTDSTSNNALLSSASTEPERVGSVGRRMSNRDIDEHIEAGSRKMLDDGSTDRRELSPSDNGRVSPSWKMPRRPLNGAPPLREW